MADIQLEDLEKALDSEGVEIDREVLRKVFRRLANPQGCEHCGQHVKVARIVRGKQVTACCGVVEGASRRKNG
jgi:hypothetical protein